MTSAGKPERLDQAKRIIRNALLGLLIVLGAAVINEVLAHAYNASAVTNNGKSPQLQAILAATVSSMCCVIPYKLHSPYRTQRYLQFLIC